MSQTAFSSVLSSAGSLYISLLSTVWILVLHFVTWKLTGSCTSLLAEMNIS